MREEAVNGDRPCTDHDTISTYVIAYPWPAGTGMEMHRQEAIAALDRLAAIEAALIAAAREVDEAWEEPDEGTEDFISMPGDEGDVEPYTPDTNEMVAALRDLRGALAILLPTQASDSKETE